MARAGYFLGMVAVAILLVALALIAGFLAVWSIWEMAMFYMETMAGA